MLLVSSKLTLLDINIDLYLHNFQKNIQPVFFASCCCVQFIFSSMKIILTVEIYIRIYL